MSGKKWIKNGFRVSRASKSNWKTVKIAISWVSGSLIWSQIGFRKNKSLSSISAWVSYDHNKFRDDTSVMGEKVLVDVGKVARKVDFAVKNLSL